MRRGLVKHTHYCLYFLIALIATSCGFQSGPGNPRQTQEIADETGKISPAVPKPTGNTNSPPAENTGGAGADPSAEACNINGILETGEECDDENTDNSDCCNQACQIQRVGQACNDSNSRTLLDKCDPNGECRGIPIPFPQPLPDPVACNHNGVTDSGEQCDDGDFDDSDECSNACRGRGRISSAHEFIPDITDPIYRQLSHDPFDLELVSDHCTKGVGAPGGESRWWLEIKNRNNPDFRIYAGGICDLHDYCYATLGRDKNLCDDRFKEQMDLACEKYMSRNLDVIDCQREAFVMRQGVRFGGGRFDDKQERRSKWNDFGFNPATKAHEAGANKFWLIQQEGAEKRLIAKSEGEATTLSASAPTMDAVWRYFLDESIRPFRKSTLCLTRIADGKVGLEACLDPQLLKVDEAPIPSAEQALRSNQTQRWGIDPTRRRICEFRTTRPCFEKSCAVETKTSCADTDQCLGFSEGDSPEPRLIPCDQPGANGIGLEVAPTPLLTPKKQLSST